VFFQDADINKEEIENKISDYFSVFRKNNSFSSRECAGYWQS
jgi:hypothetical protein